MEEAEIPEIQAMLVFTSDDVEFDAEGAALPTMKLKQLKDFMRQKGKERPLSQTALQRVTAVFKEP